MKHTFYNIAFVEICRANAAKNELQITKNAPVLNDFDYELNMRRILHDALIRSVRSHGILEIAKFSVHEMDILFGYF